jgi:hypothetical protein
MKRRNLIFAMLLIVCGLLTMQSCKKEAGTLVTEHGAFTNPVLVAPANGGFLNVTGTTVDLTWEATSTTGDPQNWNVYFGTGDDPALIKTGYTQQTVAVDVTIGTKYNWRVVGIDANGIRSQSPVWSFEIVDPAAPLKLDMTWTTDVKSIVGLDLAPEAAVALRLLILKADTLTNAVPVISTGKFESFAGFDTLADGTYFIVTDIASTIDAGTFTKPFDISINLSFSQRGTLNAPLSFANVMTTAYPCPAYKTILAKVTKVGDTYTADPAVSYITPPQMVWNGDDATFPSEVTSVAGCKLLMTGLGFGWMLNWWGETIVSGGTLYYTVSGNTITIPLQDYCHTTYLGAAQPMYRIQGTGTIDNSGAFPKWTIQYDFIQNGASIATISEGYGWPTPYFEAVITTDPAGKGVAKSVMQIDKPKRLH